MIKLMGTKIITILRLRSSLMMLLPNGQSEYLNVPLAEAQVTHVKPMTESYFKTKY